MDWDRIRHAMKHDGASLHTDGTCYWFVQPIDSNIARQIISHPAVVPGEDYQIAGVDYQTFRWRILSPAEKILNAAKAGGVQ
jgi:hypothetical protein